MNQSLLVVGGTKAQRREVAEEICAERQVSKFDQQILEDEKAIGIEEIRNLKHHLSRKVTSGQAGLIFEAQTLTIPAQNALLKTLEEPPANTIIVLTVPGKDLLLPTIGSRCQIIELLPALELELSNEELENQRSAISHQLSAGVGERLKLAQQIAQNREETLRWLDLQTLVWRQILLKKNSIEQFNNLTIEQPLSILRQIQVVKSQIFANVNPRFALENLFLNLPKV